MHCIPLHFLGPAIISFIVLGQILCQYWHRGGKSLYSSVLEVMYGRSSDKRSYHMHRKVQRDTSAPMPPASLFTELSSLFIQLQGLENCPTQNEMGQVKIKKIPYTCLLPKLPRSFSIKTLFSNMLFQINI